MTNPLLNNFNFKLCNIVLPIKAHSSTAGQRFLSNIMFQLELNQCLMSTISKRVSSFMLLSGPSNAEQWLRVHAIVRDRTHTKDRCDK